VPRWEKRQPYTQEEVGRLLAAATPDDEILVLLGAHAGLHASEMAALRWADVDLATRHLVVASGKGGKRRTVGLSRSLYLELVAARRRAGYVLPLNGEDDLTKRRMHAWYRLRQLCRKTGVQPRALHALRHTAGTRLMSENHDLELAAGVLGHSSIETTRIYSHFSDTRADKAVADW